MIRKKYFKDFVIETNTLYTLIRVKGNEAAPTRKMLTGILSVIHSIAPTEKINSMTIKYRGREMNFSGVSIDAMNNITITLSDI